MKFNPLLIQEKFHQILIKIFGTKDFSNMEKKFIEYYETLSVKQRIYFLIYFFSIINYEYNYEIIIDHFSKFLVNKVPNTIQVNNANNGKITNYSGSLIRIMSVADIITGLTSTKSSFSSASNELSIVDIENMDNESFYKAINKDLHYYVPDRPMWVSPKNEVENISTVNEFVSVLGLHHYYEFDTPENPRSLYRIEYIYDFGVLYKPHCLTSIGLFWWPNINGEWGRTENLSKFVTEPTSLVCCTEGVSEALHDLNGKSLGELSGINGKVLGRPSLGRINWNKLMQYRETKIEELLY